MEELKRFTDYDEYKAAVETELRKSAEGFVRIGYLLKQARDTDVLEGHYNNLQEFAQAEFGLDKSQVSRFIHINDRFSENGNSDKLMDHYMGFGYAKLTLMLQLPDSINEEITPSFTKTEIQTIKEELDEEKAVSDLEVMMEPVPDVIKKENEQLMKVVIALGEEEPELYTFVYTQAHLSGWDVKALQGDMVENEEKIYSVRVPGEGRYALSLKENGTVKLINMRSGDRSEHTWEELLQCWESQDLGMDPEEQWTCMYGKDFPKKEEPVAPVQQKKETKVTKAAPKEEKKVHIPKPTKENEEIDEPKEEPKEELKEEPRQQDSVDHKICINDNENSADDNRKSNEPEYIEADYREIEEDVEKITKNKVIELPCFVGDTVYKISFQTSANIIAQSTPKLISMKVIKVEYTALETKDNEIHEKIRVDAKYTNEYGEEKYDWEMWEDGFFYGNLAEVKRKINEITHSSDLAKEIGGNDEK